MSTASHPEKPGRSEPPRTSKVAPRTAEVTQHELDALRPKNKPLFLAVAANVLLAALCLGVPYVRGRQMARESIHAFGSLAACLFDGTAGSGRGLVLPPGERARFAARVMTADASWPGSCLPSLEAVAPDEAVFLWPSVKTANGDVRASVALVRRELDALTRARAAKHLRVPERPLLALERLRAALTLLAQATSVSETIDESAVSFGAKNASALPEPARLPLVASPSAQLELALRGDGLEAVAIDGRGLSWLAVEGGNVDRSRVRRSSLVRAVLRSEREAYVVWAMDESKCAAHEQRCATHAAGVAALDRGATTLTQPSWYGAHPAGRVDRSVLIAEPSVYVLARASAEGTLELRRFELPAAQGLAESEREKPRAALERFAFPESGAPQHAVLLRGYAPEVAYLHAAQGQLSARVWRPIAARQDVIALQPSSESRAPDAAEDRSRADVLELGTLGETEGAFITACGRVDARVIAYGNAKLLRVARVAGATVMPLHEGVLGVDAALSSDDPAHDRVRAACVENQSIVLALDREHELHAVRCGQDACEHAALARGVESFDVARSGEAWLVALSRRSDPSIQLVRLRADRPAEALPTPAACWDPESGMCGSPRLVADHERVLLVAREGSDLRALESRDHGTSWQPPGALIAEPTPARDASAPLDQHRLRKGLDK